MRHPDVILDFIRTLEFNMVFGGGDEEALSRRRDQLIQEYQEYPPG